MMGSDSASNKNPLAKEAVSNYSRLVPLEGGNNFRDLGGYLTADNKTVKRGRVFRSGLMTRLTEADQEALNRLGINTVVDFRSREELDLFPNHWARKANLKYLRHDYSMRDISSRMFDERGNRLGIDVLYRNFPSLLKPQLTLLFRHLIEGNTPLVFNCSAGQDRTGIASAMLLAVLGVTWETIVEDYHLSTLYRRPEIETCGVDLSAHAETNAFAQMMLRYGEREKKPRPLMNGDKIPYLNFAFGHIENTYGSVFGYLAEEIGVDDAAIDRLKELYLES